MANPQSQIPSAQLPYIDTVCTNPDGTPTLLFHRFLTGIFQRTGGAAGIGSSDVQEIATEALTTANRALTEANAADSSANAAQTTANSAQSLATTANTNASSALSIASSAYNQALFKTNNLGDLTNLPTARSNLGLNTYPAVFTFDTLSNGLRRGIPLVRSLQMPANFNGTICYEGTNTTSDAVFTVQVYRSGAYISIGTITFVHAGAGFLFSTQGAFNLGNGDVLVVKCPSPADATLAEAAITFPLLLL